MFSSGAGQVISSREDTLSALVRFRRRVWFHTGRILRPGSYKCREPRQTQYLYKSICEIIPGTKAPFTLAIFQASCDCFARKWVLHPIAKFLATESREHKNV